MSDEAKKPDAIADNWQPVAVVSLDKRPRSAMNAIWDIATPAVYAACLFWIFLGFYAAGLFPVWRYTALFVISALSIWSIIDGVKHWLSRPRA